MCARVCCRERVRACVCSGDLHAAGLPVTPAAWPELLLSDSLAPCDSFPMGAWLIESIHSSGNVGPMSLSLAWLHNTRSMPRLKTKLQPDRDLTLVGQNDISICLYYKPCLRYDLLNQNKTFALSLSHVETHTTTHKVRAGSVLD